MNSFLDWLKQLDFGFLSDLLYVIPASLLCIMFHEVSHGVVALKLGDPTAKNAGRLTFNPVKHVDVWGLVMMAIFRFGWAKPVPVNMRNFKPRPVNVASYASGKKPRNRQNEHELSQNGYNERFDPAVKSLKDSLQGYVKPCKNKAERNYSYCAYTQSLCLARKPEHPRQRRCKDLQQYKSRRHYNKRV